MIIKKLNQFPLIKIISKFISKFIFIIGTIFFFIIIILSFYYFNSGMYERYKPPLLMEKINDKIIYKYFGFDIYKIDSYILNNLKSLKYLIFDNELENVVIKIDTENLYNLELQRNDKLKGLSNKNAK